MNCYDCQPETTPAVAVCVACGKGVCPEHCVRHDREVVEKVASGMAAQERHTGRKVPRMLCGECAAGMGGNVCPQVRGR
ncbi:MAG: DUF2180 family protein [Armatimonadota bacterium]